MRYDIINSVQITEDLYLRCDPKFHFFVKTSNWSVFLHSKLPEISLGDFLSSDQNTFIIEEGKDYKGIPTGRDYIDADGEIIDYLLVNIDNCPDRLKYKVTKDNVLISSIRQAVTPALNFSEVENLDNYVFSNGFYVLKTRGGINSKIALYLLRLKKLKHILDNSIYRGIGISSYKLPDLLRLRIPQFDSIQQNQILSLIRPIEQKIKNLKKNIEDDDVIINRVLLSEFGWDFETFYSLRKTNIYHLDFCQVGNNYDMRYSPKFHRPSGRFVYEDIKKTNCLRIKDFIDAPISLGASVSPSDFNSNGECYYISMATVKNFKIELDESQLLSEEYERTPKNEKKKVKKGDIIMTRSGAAIGKFALVEEEMNAIHSDFTMRIRLKNIDLHFAYYYFRSVYFQYLIEINYKGLQNNNIFPNQIQEFPIPDISLERQKEIVAQIESKIKEQNNIKEEVEKLRTEIDKIIENTITSHSR